MDVKTLRMLLGKYPDDYKVVVYCKYAGMSKTACSHIFNRVKEVSYKRAEVNIVDIVIE